MCVFDVPAPTPRVFHNPSRDTNPKKKGRHTVELKDWQSQVKRFDAERGWDYFHPMEIFMNINEEMAEIWHHFRWVGDAEKERLAKEHRDAIEFDVGDLLCLVLKLANQFGVNAERGLERVLAEFGEVHPPKPSAQPEDPPVSSGDGA
jgi:NTP pyrophosphatase (non-canonical NTP hydrolase)